MLAIGIDWGDKAHAVAILMGPGSPVRQFVIPDTPQGYHQLLAAVSQIPTPDPDPLICFAIERKDHRLVQFLLDHGCLGYYVEPNKTDAFRQRYRSSRTKSDRQDAFILADILFRDRDHLPLIVPEHPAVLQVRLLLTARLRSVYLKVQLANQLNACLGAYFPHARGFFADPTRPTALDFLSAYPTPEAARQVSVTNLEQFLRQHHVFPQRFVRNIYQCAQAETITLPPVVVRCRSLELQQIVPQLKAVQRAIAFYDQELQTVTAENPEVRRFQTIPGAGLIVSSGFYVLFGEDRTRYTDASQVQSYIGTAPRTIASGEQHVVAFRYACNHLLRDVAFQLAQTSIHHVHWAKRYHQAKVKEGKGYYHAVRCLANIWVRIAFAMWSQQVDYNESQFLADRERHRLNNQATD